MQYANDKLLNKLPKLDGKGGWPWTEENYFNNHRYSHIIPWPKISIVTPSYNQGLFIEETIRSVLLQGYPNLEYIIMDGGSTDKTEEILSKYTTLITYISISKDEGQSDALSNGFKNATGDILAWINSDDRYRPGTLFRIGEFFYNHPDMIFINSDVNLINQFGILINRMYAVPPNWVLSATLGLHGWPQPGCFWRREAYERSGGIDKSLKFCMDRDLFIRLTKLGKSKRLPGPPTADFRTHENAKSSMLLDIAEYEGRLLTEKYSIKLGKICPSLFKAMWWLWNKPTNLRARLNKKFGWEY